jgi:hypothetical protein
MSEPNEQYDRCWGCRRATVRSGRALCSRCHAEHTGRECALCLSWFLRPGKRVCEGKSYCSAGCWMMRMYGAKEQSFRCTLCLKPQSHNFSSRYLHNEVGQLCSLVCYRKIVEKVEFLRRASPVTVTAPPPPPPSPMVAAPTATAPPLLLTLTPPTWASMWGERSADVFQPFRVRTKRPQFQMMPLPPPEPQPVVVSVELPPLAPAPAPTPTPAPAPAPAVGNEPEPVAVVSSVPSSNRTGDANASKKGRPRRCKKKKQNETRPFPLLS